MIEEKISALRARAQNSLGKHHIGNTSVRDIRKHIDNAGSSVEKDLIRKKYLAKKLFENQHLIEQMERHANMGFWELNLYTNETVWSDGLYRLLGLGPHQFTPNPQSIIDLAYPAYAESITSKFVELLEHGTAFTMEIKIKAFNSHVQYVSIHNELLEDEDGYPVRISGSVMDITKRILAQKEDHRTKSLYKDLIDNMPIGLAQIGIRGNVDLMNKTMREYLRHENEDFEGKTISDLSSEHVFKGRFFKMLNAIEKGAPLKFEDTFNDNVYSNIVVPHETETHTSGLLLSTDITNERRQKMALEKSEAKFRSFVEEANDIIYSINSDGIFSYVSPNIIELLGYSPEELMGNSSVDIIHPEDRSIVLLTIQNIAETKAKVANVHYRVANKSGEYLWHTSNATPILDDFGNVVQINGISRNIHEQKLAEQKLVETKNILKQYLEQAPYGVLVVDKACNIVSSNREAQFITGVRDPEHRALTLYDLIVERDVEKADACFNQLRDRNYASTIVQFGKRLKNPRTVSMKMVKINENRHVIFTNDITQQKEKSLKIKQQNNDLKALNATKDKFFSIIAHDIKNPFANLLGFAQLLEQVHNTVTPEKRASHIKNLHQSAKNIYSLLENLLTWSRLQRNVIKQNIQPVHIDPVVKETTYLLAQMAEAKNIELVQANNDEVLIEADVNMLETTLRNLVSNAIKYTPDGGKVTIGYERYKNTQLKIWVSDTGIGIDEAYANKLFKIDENFSRVGTNGEDGTGLGLILCKEFVQKNKGKIWFESKPNQGSTFYFTVYIVD